MKVAEFILIVLLRLYRATLSPVLGFLCGGLGLGCRFHPTCSQYAIEAVQRFGAVKGSVLAGKRLARCHPWGGSGYDPVPVGRGERGEERGETGITITRRIKILKKFMVLHERQAHGS